MNKAVSVLILFCTLTFGVSSGAESSVLDIKYTDEDIIIDGKLNEPIWKSAGQLTDFRQNKPAFGEPVSFKTGLKVIYNNRMICIAFECEDTEAAKITAVAERDGAIANDDSIVFLLDTFNDKRNAYLFAVNPRGTRFDAKIMENGRSWDLNWNRNWQAACEIKETGWVAEIGIPFDEIAFDRHTKVMGFNAIRNIPRKGEEAFLILNQSNPWDVSTFGQIRRFDLSGVDSKKYENNLELHKSTIKKIRENFIKSDKYILKNNLFYKPAGTLSPYESERCFLDLYLPEDVSNFPVIVWFYGGSLEHGSKEDLYTQDMAKHFAHRGIAVAVVDYRLSPEAKFPAYIEDAASSVAWVINHIAEFNGDPSSVFIAGHSAGGYLTYILGMDRKYLKAVNVEIGSIAGFIPISGQTFTHYTVRAERGIPNPENTPVIDEAGPCFYAQKSGPPILVICGDKDPQDRIEENHYFLALLKKVGYKNVEYFEAEDRTHWELIQKIPTVDDPVSKAIMAFINKYSQTD